LLPNQVNLIKETKENHLLKQYSWIWVYMDLSRVKKTKGAKSCTACIPVTLNVKDGLHHDLSAITTEDLEGPNFPCK